MHNLKDRKLQLQEERNPTRQKDKTKFCKEEHTHLSPARKTSNANNVGIGGKDKGGIEQVLQTRPQRENIEKVKQIRRRDVADWTPRNYQENVIDTHTCSKTNSSA